LDHIFAFRAAVMLSFHTSLHARSESAVTSAKPVDLGGQSIRALSVPPESLTTPFALSFEQAGEALEKLDRLFFEPDGSFVWTSPHGEPKWQVDGNLFDRAGRLLFVDLKGTCPSREFDRLLSAFGWPETSVMFQLVREAVFLDEAEFRRFAETAPSGQPN
jgi:hypothetical protein